MIFYLSGTGNTKWVAESVARELGETVVDVAKVYDEDVEYVARENEYLGFCFPVHGWRPPKMILDFMRKVKLPDADRFRNIFIICTAGDTVGEALCIANQVLYECGYDTRSYYDVRMPNTYVGLPFMDVDSDEVAKRKIETAKRDIVDICREIRGRKAYFEPKYIGNWPKTNSFVLGEFFSDCLVTDRHFHVDRKKCSRCGICASVCPVENVEGGAGQTPRWKHNKRCMTCFACYHYCPKHAIRYGWMTWGKGQYHFPKANPRSK